MTKWQESPHTININSECQWTPFGKLDKKEDPIICCLQETYIIDRNKQWLSVKGWKKIY
jgi:hypothetical protein